MDTDYIILVILTYFLIIIGGAAGIGLIVVFLRKLGKIESKDKLEEEKLDDLFQKDLELNHNMEEVLVIVVMIAGGLTGFLMVKFIQKKLKDKNKNNQKA